MNWFFRLLQTLLPVKTSAVHLKPVDMFESYPYAGEYEALFAVARIAPDKLSTVDWYVKRMKAGRSRYEVVSKLAGGNIPWWIIAALHALECSCDFNKHLHNGDPLARKTVRVPKGRPLTDTWTWESSAVDALRRLGFHEVKNWTIGHALDHLEKYNGLGYRNKGVPSPYLWSFTQHYFKGKYVADHKYDPNAVSKQPGVAALLKRLEPELGNIKSY